MSLFGKTHAADACCECAFGPHMIFPHVRKQTRRCYSHVSLKMSKYYRQNICNLLLKLTFLVKSILSCLSSKTINKGSLNSAQMVIVMMMVMSSTASRWETLFSRLLCHCSSWRDHPYPPDFFLSFCKFCYLLIIQF